MKLRFFVSLALLIVVIGFSNPGQILGVLGRADVRWIGCGIAIWVGIQFLYVWKWWLLTQAQSLRVSLKTLLEIYLCGMFFNTFLPSGFGGDVVRVCELSKLVPEGGAGSLASVTIDRFTSLYALCLVAGLGLFVGSGSSANKPWSTASAAADLLAGMVVAAVVGGAIVFFALLNPRWLRKIAKIPAIAKRAAIASFLFGVADGLSAMGRSHTSLLAALVIAALSQILAVILHFCFIRALGLDVSIGYLAYFFPLIALFASLPITVNGLAVREGGFVFFLGPVGVEASQAVSVGLLSLSMLLLSGICGAIVYGRGRRAVNKPAG